MLLLLLLAVLLLLLLAVAGSLSSLTLGAREIEGVFSAEVTRDVEREMSAEEIFRIIPGRMPNSPSVSSVSSSSLSYRLEGRKEGRKQAKEGKTKGRKKQGEEGACVHGEVK